MGETNTFYWFGSQTDVKQALSDWIVNCEPVELNVPQPQTAVWAAAASALVDEVVAATAEYNLAHERIWRRRWGRRRRFAKADAVCLSRMRAAVAAYSPVRKAVDEFAAHEEEVRREQRRREEAQRQRRLAEARSRFAAWQERQAVAQRPLPDGLTPYELAYRGGTPPVWPPEVRDAVGDVESWWAGLVAWARNERALSAAVQKVVAAITSTAAALEAAGRPGITAVKEEPSKILYGWRIEFDWSNLPGTEPLSTPPDIPVDHLPGGDWTYDLYLPSRILLTPARWGTYELATVRSDVLPNLMGTTHRWWSTGIKAFAEDLIPTHLMYRGYPSSYDNYVLTRLPRHADPAVYVPYVQAVAERAAAHFTALMPQR